MDIDDLLGEGWLLRVANTNGDFSHLILRYYMRCPTPLLNFEPRGRTEEIELVPFYTEQPTVIVFQFVKTDGNRRELISFMN